MQYSSTKSSLLPAVPKSINKNFVVFDCNWANRAAKFKCTLKSSVNQINKIGNLNKLAKAKSGLINSILA